MADKQLVEHHPDALARSGQRGVVSSNHRCSIVDKNKQAGAVAQLVEHHVRNVGVGRSNRLCSTTLRLSG